MSFCPTILAQIKNFTDRLEFDRIVKDKCADKYVKKITCQRLQTILMFTNLSGIKSIAASSAEADKTFAAIA